MLGPCSQAAPAYLDGTVLLVLGDPVGLLASAARATGRSREYVFTADGPGGTPLGTRLPMRSDRRA